MNLVYGLIDPSSNELRYVGKTKKGFCRPSSHWLCKKELARKDHCHAWVRSVISAGLTPEVIVIEQDHRSFEDLNDAEIFWIAYFRSIGCRLTNLTDGGDGGGVRGRPVSAAVREKISAAKMGKKLSAEHKAKIGAAHLGKKRSEKTRERMRAAWCQRDSTVSDEIRQRLSESHRGKIASIETKQKMSETHRKIWKSRKQWS